MERLEGENVESALVDAYRLLYTAAAALEDAAVCPDSYRKAGIEPESIYFGAASSMKACAEMLNYLVSESLVEGRPKMKPAEQ